jgi:glycosyltransferase involved in cell wall biosynthesis
MNTQTPLISVVVPSYNCAQFLPQAIESVISQSFQNWEMIIIDNHSTDGTESLVKSYEDERIKLYSIQNQGVIAASRNLGIKVSDGQWIAFLDADDYWRSDKLQRCLEKSKEGFDVIYHPMKIVRDRFLPFSRNNTKSWQLRHPILQDLLLRGNPIANSSAFVKKELLIEVGYINEDKGLIAAEDFNTWLEISRVSNKFVLLDACLGSYRAHDSNTSSSLDRTVPHEKVVARFIDEINSGDQEKAKALISYFRGQYLFNEYEYGSACEQFLMASRHLDVDLKFKNKVMFYKSKIKALLCGMTI